MSCPLESWENVSKIKEPLTDPPASGRVDNSPAP
jgi:hypothetical protein